MAVISLKASRLSSSPIFLRFLSPALSAVDFGRPRPRGASLDSSLGASCANGFETPCMSRRRVANVDFMATIHTHTHKYEGFFLYVIVSFQHRLRIYVFLAFQNQRLKDSRTTNTLKDESMCVCVCVCV